MKCTKDAIDDIQEDALVITSVLSGDTEAFRVIVTRYKDQIFSIIMRQVGDMTVAEDITQESFIRAYKGLKSFDHKSSFYTWMVRIALNQINTYFTSKRYKQFLRNTKIEDADEIHAAETADQYLLDKEMIDRFRLGLGRLKRESREVLILCGVEGRSYEEVSKILDIPIGTVRSRLNKARADLQKILKDSR